MTLYLQIKFYFQWRPQTCLILLPVALSYFNYTFSVVHFSGTQETDGGGQGTWKGSYVDIHRGRFSWHFYDLRYQLSC